MANWIHKNPIDTESVILITVSPHQNGLKANMKVKKNERIKEVKLFKYEISKVNLKK